MTTINFDNCKLVTREMKALKNARKAQYNKAMRTAISWGAGAGAGSAIGHGEIGLGEVLTAGVVALATGLVDLARNPELREIGREIKSNKKEYNEVVKRAKAIQKAKKVRLKKEERANMEKQVRIEQLLGFLA